MKRLYFIIKVLSWPVRWLFATSKSDELWINAFADWFGGIPGFKQQMTFMLGWVVIVLVYPRIDPNMLHLMAFLTIYSGITQPMIAIGTSRSVLMQMRLLQNNIHQSEVIIEILKQLTSDGSTDDIEDGDD